MGTGLQVMLRHGRGGIRVTTIAVDLVPDVPDGVILDEAGFPLLDEDGNYITEE